MSDSTSSQTPESIGQSSSIITTNTFSTGNTNTTTTTTTSSPSLSVSSPEDEEQRQFLNTYLIDFETPEEYLLYYARTGNLDKLKKLFDLVEREKMRLDINAKGKQKSNRGWTALHLASYFGHFDVVQLLINKKAMVNVINENGDTPLHKAAFVGRVDIVTLLLANNADVFVKNEELKMAKQLTKSPTVQELLINVELADRKRKEAYFLSCAKNGDLGELKSLLVGPDPVDLNCQDDSGNTALHLSALRAHKQIITWLLQQPGIDSNIKNNRGQIAASLASSIAMKQLLLDVQPSLSGFKDVEKARVNRFEGALMRKNRFMVWRKIWCVLEKGVLSFYNNRADASTGFKRKHFIYLESAFVEADANPNMFTVYFNVKCKVQLQILNITSSVNYPVDRQKWINAIQEHIAYSKKFIQQGFKIEDDSEDDISEILPTNYLQNLINTAQAHESILNRHIRGLRQFVDEDLKLIQAQFPETISVECSQIIMECIKKFWPTLTFHLNFIQESSRNTSAALQQCLNVMDKQDKLRQLQLRQANEKSRTLEEIVHVLAQQQHDFEKSMGQQASFQSPPRSKEGSSDLNESDCEEYFDAFGDEGEESTGDSETTLNDSIIEGDEMYETVQQSSAHRHEQNDPSSEFVANQHRQSLPVPMLARADVSLWSILKNCIGKDLSRITMPVVFNEPLTFLQRMAESMGYSKLLQLADQSADPIERMEYVAAFVVASVSNNWMRMNKPFNPLLGETYELKDEQRNFMGVCEQVSHHPPISAFHFENNHYIKYGSVYPKLKFWGKSIEVKPEGGHTLRLKKCNETYTWSNVNCCIHNIIVGKLWFEQYGTLEVVNHQQNLKAVLNFKSAGWFGKDLHRVEGFISTKGDDPIKIKFLYGKWTDYLKSAPIEDYETYLNNNSQQFIVPEKVNPEQRKQMINETTPAAVQSSSSAQNTPKKKLTSKLNNLSLRNFTVSLESELGQDKETNDSTTLDLDQDVQQGGDLMNKSGSSSSLDIANSRILWMSEPRPDNSADYYNFSLFTFQLNELTEDMKSYLPPTDSRFRPDVRLLELGELDASAEEKNRLEEKQREIRKLRKKNKETFSPLWFKIERNPFTKEEGWAFNGRYFERNYSKCPDIF